MEREWLFAAALEDARERHKAVYELIRFTDQQAMALLNLYCTLGVASASGAAASLGRDAIIPLPVGSALGVAALFFILGAGCCFRVLASATINLPGREAGFWTWANSYPTLGLSEILAAYLDGVADREAMNNGVNATGAKWLGRARLFGLIAPFTSLCIAIGTWYAA
ncbi:hypothetical protein [Xanthobacter sp. KR7-225]|uniref:hypothetical protein n=1 Tax=Xanthobacter sp. KR7-225 TaxID=3156613 RepID=UPI0032B34FA8